MKLEESSSSSNNPPPSAKFPYGPFASGTLHDSSQLSYLLDSIPQPARDKHTTAARMDFLKAEIANKRKAVEITSAPAAAAPPPNKYMRRGDLEKLQQQQKRSASPSSSASPRPGPSTERLRLSKSETTSPAASSSLSSATKSALDTAAGEVEREKFNVSNEEAVRRLRAKGEPIRLFAETDKERRLRLRALELIEEKGGGTLGQNDFRNALQSAESATALELLEKRNPANKGKGEQARLDSLRQDAATKSAIDDAEKALTSKQQESNGANAEDEDQASKPVVREGVGMDSLLDLNLIKTDIDRVYPIIYYTLKGLLSEWADSLASRPDEVKHTMQGKLAAATQVQSADYLKPLFKKLRKRSLPPDVLMRVAEIVHFMQKRQYRNANDSYLQLSIGNAPWPIGVTMVGIHERSGREKIFSSNVAHVLNDEVSRKYIQSLKRLMTFAQTKYPPEDISMMMG